MIEIKELYKTIEGQRILDGVNLSVAEGKTLALIGGSGKGKSVLLKHIIGLMHPDTGQILIDRKDVSHLKGKDLKALKDRFGIVFQGGALFDSLSVFENIAFPLREKTTLSDKEITQKVTDELKNVNLLGHGHKYPSQISGGMKKRVALARCLVMDPEIILFDEPTTGLDPMTVKSIHKLISNLQKERNLTAIIVSHDIPEIFNVVDSVALLHNGRIAMAGTSDEMQNSTDPVVMQFLSGELER